MFAASLFCVENSSTTFGVYIYVGIHVLTQVSVVYSHPWDHFFLQEQWKVNEISFIHIQEGICPWKILEQYSIEKIQNIKNDNHSFTMPSILVQPIL